jgi:hypothetical protein
VEKVGNFFRIKIITEKDLIQHDAIEKKKENVNVKDT